jgi:hypothetical protein
LCWPQTFKELFRFNFNALLPTLHFLSEVDCKGTTFFITGNLFFQLFSIKYLIQLSINDIKFYLIQKNTEKMMLFIRFPGLQQAEKRCFGWFGRG